GGPLSTACAAGESQVGCRWRQSFGWFPIGALAHGAMGFCFDRGVGRKNTLHPAADARGDGLFRRATAFADALWRGLEGVRGLERLDPSGEFGNAWPQFGARLRVGAGKAGLELITQS